MHQRQIRFSGIGEEGQRKLHNARTALIGCGALGSVLAERLTRAGVGHLRLIDRDYVEPQNLFSQTLYDQRDAQNSLPKAIAAERKLSAINPDIKIEPVVSDLNSENAEELLQDADLILDGTDNFETRFLINDLAVKLKIPWIYAAIVESHGLTMSILPAETGCLRCWLENPPSAGALPTCETSGVIGGIAGAIASIASTEALKILMGAKNLNAGLLHLDLWENLYKIFPVERRPACICCGQGKFQFLDAPSAGLAGALCGRDAIQIKIAQPGGLDLKLLASKLSNTGQIFSNNYLLRLKLSDHELVIFQDGRVIVKGTPDPGVARSLCAQYIGT